ncbi:hypothetical protein MTBBW1_1210014 [Desulfamplus magnetovallimortis]|uniref:Uncharacterized protein n=1 Tax=Desulfamplus magnetovallimortis TaxID=1246637 RepID=A0A1W1H6B3_9BACT|nr:hypothetical protein [Desulfamplus magnetovallimortis]SLM27974.1 hypothetical protein MTBBW1_1210014 [Desulfamplus magnetovallimortis]
MKKQSNRKSSASLSELKRLILTLNNGITESTLNQINAKTDQLSLQFTNDKVLSTFTKMVKALVSYILSKRDELHSEALPLLNSVINNMEMLSSTKGASLSNEQKQNLLSKEIANFNRFKQMVQQPGRAASQPSSTADDSPIANLKSIILSLDWEISEEIIQNLDKEVNHLKRHWQNSKIHLSFLQMFQSIGRYVHNRGANTHPDAISLLNSLYKNFEQVVLQPNLSQQKQQDILSREIQKFNQLKQIISSPPARKPTPQGMNPMDDLIGTKVSNLSPVDDLIEEIHMLQDDGNRTHSPGGVNPAATSSTPDNPNIREVIPDRGKNQPIPEIQSRLDAFFDEDEPMDFADSGDEVVPYTDGSQSSSAQTSTPSPKDEKDQWSDGAVPFEDEQDDLFDDIDPFTPEDDPGSNELAFENNLEPPYEPIDDNAKPSSRSADSTNGMVPYDFEDEFFETEAEHISATAKDTQSANSEKIPQIDMALLDNVKSTVAKCMFDGNINSLESVNSSISSIQQQIDADISNKNVPSELQVMLNLYNAFKNSLAFVPQDTIQSGVEGMLFCLDCIEHSQKQEFDNSVVSEYTLSSACNRYINFQNNLLQLLDQGNLPQGDKSFSSTNAYASGEGVNNAPPDSEQLMSGAMQEEEAFTDPRPQGFWAKLKRMFGLS